MKNLLNVALTLSSLYLLTILAALVMYAFTGDSFITLEAGDPVFRGLVLFLLTFGSAITFGCSIEELNKV